MAEADWGKRQVTQMWATTPHPTVAGLMVRMLLGNEDGVVSVRRIELVLDEAEPLTDSPTLKALRWGRVGERIIGDIKVGATAEPHGPFGSWANSFMAIPRVGRGRRPDRPYAEVAARYVAALEADPRAPIRHMLETEGIEAGGIETESSLRAKLNKARVRGLLTKAPAGKPGGELTDKARRLLGMED
ncbi:MAG: hypothetical protein U0P45_17235 [Acidimicrobiales bacterium]